MHPAMRLLALALAATAAACAHDRGSHYTALGPLYYEPPPPPAEITRYADDNRDGQVTRQEAEADPALVRVFGQYDADDDGALNRAEFARLEEDSRARGTDSVYISVVPIEVPPEASAADSLNRTGIDEIRPRSE